MRQMCSVLGKSSGYVRRLQMTLGLPVPRRPERYPEKYVLLLRRVVSLRTFNVTVEDIKELLAKEQKILQLLHFDSVSNSPFWFMHDIDPPVPSERHLLLTGVDLGFPVTGSAIQCNLDFMDRDPELFGRHEMGEDVRRVLDLYLELLRRIDERVSEEKPVLQEALAWAGRGLVGLEKQKKPSR